MLSHYIICALFIFTFAIIIFISPHHAQRVLSYIIPYLGDMGVCDAISTFFFSVPNPIPIERPVDNHLYSPSRPACPASHLQEIAHAAVWGCRENFPNDDDACIRIATFFIVAVLNNVHVELTARDLVVVNEITKSLDELERFRRPPATSLMSILRHMIPDHPDPLELVFPTWKTLRQLVGQIRHDEPARLAFQALYNSQTVSDLSMESIMSHIMHRYLLAPTPTLPRRSIISSIFRSLVIGDGDDIEASAHPHGSANTVPMAAGLILAEMLN